MLTLVLTIKKGNSAIKLKMGINGGYIWKLDVTSPLKSNNSDLWNPHNGQSIPNICL